MTTVFLKAFGLVLTIWILRFRFPLQWPKQSINCFSVKMRLLEACIRSSTHLLNL